MATVLIVDDRETDRRFLSTLLGYAGHRCVEASDGMQALEIFAERRPDLVITDVLMPGMDGFQFIRQLRADGREVPVIFYSATYNNNEAHSLMAFCGRAVVLPKPSEPQAILACVADVLDATPDLIPVPANEPVNFDSEHLRLVNQKLLDKVIDLEASERRLGHLLDENARLVRELRASADHLRENEARTYFALRVARAGVWERDLRTDRVTLSEPLVELIRDEVPGFDATRESLRAVVHPDDHILIDEAVARAIATRSELSVEFRTAGRSGRVRRLHTRARMVFDDSGQATRMIGVTMDVTERHLLEEQFRQAQKMEAVGQLAGGVAHDFNNLLTAILSYARFVKEDAPQCAADVDEIIKGVERGVSLTKHLLAFSRKQVLEVETIDLNALLGDLAGMMRRIIGDGIVLETALAPDLWPVWADRGQLEQVVMNLIVNARDAIGDIGVVRISTRNTELDADARPEGAPPEFVLLSVSDTGTGMAEETRARLFEPFFTTKPRGQGTGLGLATVYGIVTQSGGVIRVESTLGHGATFKVYLPRNVQRQLPWSEPEAEEAPAPKGSGTILLVEDDQAVRHVTRHILERAGYTVRLATDPADAERQFADADHIDVLLTDVMMPGGTGPQLAARLCARRPGLRVAYMSGYTDRGTLDRATLDQHGVFIAKPFSAETLLARLQKLLGR